MREPFKWNAVAGAPMSNYWILNSQAYNKPLLAEQRRPVGRGAGRRFRIVARDLSNLDRGPQNELGAALRIVPCGVEFEFASLVLSCGTMQVRRRCWWQSTCTAHRGRRIWICPTASIPGGSTTVRDILTGQYLSNLTDANKSAYPVAIGAYGYRLLDMNVIPGEPVPDPGAYDGLGIPADCGVAQLVALQNNATGLGDNVSEADALYVRPTGAGLRIGITGKRVDQRHRIRAAVRHGFRWAERIDHDGH